MSLCVSFKRIRPGSAFHLPTDALNPPLSFRGAGLSLSWPACSDNCCLWICHCQNSRSTATEEQWTAEPARPLGNIPLLAFAGWKKDLRVSQLHWKVAFQPAFAFLLASLLLGRCYLMANINRIQNLISVGKINLKICARNTPIAPSHSSHFCPSWMWYQARHRSKSVKKFQTKPAEIAFPTIYIKRYSHIVGNIGN